MNDIKLKDVLGIPSTGERAQERSSRMDTPLSQRHFSPLHQASSHSKESVEAYEIGRIFNGGNALEGQGPSWICRSYIN